MKLNNGLDVSIEKSWYHKDNNNYPMFNLNIYKSYFANSDVQMVQNVIQDLEMLITELKQINYD